MKNQTTLIHQFIIAASRAPETENALEKIVPLLDLTSLSDNETEEEIKRLCDRAKTPYGNVASVCVYPRFVRPVKERLAGTLIKVCTVANYPEGKFDLKQATADLEMAINEGADEVDLVLPFRDYINGRWGEVKEFVKKCRLVCGKRILLKVILETGVLDKVELVASASQDAISAGADFIKTSTGKLERGASLEASGAMLMAIKEAKDRFGQRVGFKASGGIKTPEAALCYLNLAEAIMGKGWATPAVFRIGASGIV